MKFARRIGRALDAVVFRLGQGPTRLMRAAREALLRSGLYALTLQGRTPDALTPLATPPWVEPDGDSDGLRTGFLTIGARRVPFDPDAWTHLPADEGVRAACHGFSWLALLTETDDDREQARRLLTAWLDANARWSRDAWQMDVLADRLSAWAHWAPALLSGEANDALRTRTLRSFMVQTRHLARSGGQGAPTDWRAFATCRGLIRCGLSAPGAEMCLTVGLRRLEAEISRQILPDGGHIQRCPSIHMRVLALLTDIRDAVADAHVEGPAALQIAIDRMGPMLRLFRLGDGGLTVVNGGHEETRALVDRVLNASGAKGKGLLNAPHTGFQRVTAGSVCLIADTGTPPPPGAQMRAHAGTLAFEMSIGPHRVVVNCGAPASADGAWTAATRATAAHSTVSIDDTNAAEFLPGGRIGAGPTEVHSQRREADGAVWLDTEHNGYIPTLGMGHKRRFYISGTGEDMRGEDVITGDGAKTFRVRFHLHPQVQASLIQGGTGVLLRLPGGAGWRFFATGGTVSLEDSIYSGAGQRPRRSEQIIVAGLLDSEETVVKWRFSRVGA